MKSKRPAWSDTSVSVERSLGQIRGLLQSYGAERWAFPETSSGDIDIFFVFKGQQVSLSLHATQMYKRLRSLHPKSKESELRDRAKRIIARHAYNYLKVTFEVIETGLFSIAEALLPHFTTQSGERLIDLVGNIDPQINKLLIEERSTHGES